MPHLQRKKFKKKNREISSHISKFRNQPGEGVADDAAESRSQDRIPVRSFKKTSDEKVNVVDVEINLGKFLDLKFK